jgi:hypothetical protein
MSRNGGVMKTDSDKMFDRYKDYDFTDAKTVAETPHLAKLQAEAGGKLHILQRTPDKV